MCALSAVVVAAVFCDRPQAHLDEAVSARDSLSRLAEDQQEQIDRLRRRAKRKEEEITKVNELTDYINIQFFFVCVLRWVCVRANTFTRVNP